MQEQQEKSMDIEPTTVLELNDGTTLAFTVGKKDYIRLTNDLMPGKMHGPQFNFLTATVQKDKKEWLAGVLDNNPQLVQEFFKLVFEEYKPDTALTVKKRNGEPTG